VELINTLNEIRVTNRAYSFEIVVSDNASTDSTYSIMKTALDNGLIDSYIRRSVNLTADVNILNCFNATCGDFVWILCDDDLPTSSSIANIHAVISNFRDVSLIFLNRSIELMDGKIYMSVCTNCDNGIELSKASIINTTGIELLTASTLVLKRQYKPGIYSRLFGVGKNISPLTMALTALEGGPTFLFKEPQVRYREGEKPWISEWNNIRTINVPEALKFFCKCNQIDESLINWTPFDNSTSLASI
jgi:glycosyltransferase involved in cell wall biosynthesis